MLYQISVENSKGEFVPWEIIDLPNAAAAYDRCQSLSAMYEGNTYSAAPVAASVSMLPVMEATGWVRRHPRTVAAICGALASGPVWWAIFHFI